MQTIQRKIEIVISKQLIRHVMRKIYLLLIIPFLSACNSSNNRTLTNADWLIGTWKGTTKNNTVFFETWQRNSDSVFINSNYRLQNNDTIVGGKSKIILRNGNLFYSNGMTDTKESTWRATKYSTTEIVFENGGFQKLQAIKFELTSDNKFQATLFGNKDTINYLLERVN